MNETREPENGFENGDYIITPDMLTMLGPTYYLPEAGRISPGIKVLKEGCSVEDKKTYESMVEQGHSWSEIEKAIGKDAEGKAKLRPINLGHLTVHPQKCADPKHADQIMQAYADTDGNLRSLPVIFLSDNWWEIIPHGLKCFGYSGIRYKSNFRLSKDAYGRTEAVRICEAPSPLVPGKKVFGGRGYVENRICEPDDCPEYQNGECKFSGEIHFSIPGIKTVGVWKLPTNSWYSLAPIKSTLELVYKMSGGRLAGLLDDEGKPIFSLSKVEGTVSRIDTAKGKSVKADQWLIFLNANVDIAELIRRSSVQNLVSRGEKAAALLGSSKAHHTGQPSAGSTSESLDARVIETTATSASASVNATDTTGTHNVAGSAEKQPQEAGSSAQSGASEGNNSVDDPTKSQKPADKHAPAGAGTGDATPAKDQQKNAIRNMATVKGVDKDKIETVLKSISDQTAREYIAKLNKGDVSMFG